MNPDFRDMLGLLLKHDVDFLLVGAHAFAAHYQPRATADIDIWVRPSAHNAKKVWTALAEFGAPLQLFVESDFARPGLVAQIGVAPHRVDLLTSISGVTFDEAWPQKLLVRMEELPKPVPVIGKDDLIRNKLASARPKDLLDAKALQPPAIAPSKKPGGRKHSSGTRARSPKKKHG